MHSHIKATLAGAVSAVAMFSFGSAAIAGGHLTATGSGTRIRVPRLKGRSPSFIRCFQDRTAQRMAAAFKKRYGLGDDFQFNSLRKGTGATVAQVQQEIQGRQVHR